MLSTWGATVHGLVRTVVPRYAVRTARPRLVRAPLTCSVWRLGESCLAPLVRSCRYCGGLRPRDVRVNVLSTESTTIETEHRIESEHREACRERSAGGWRALGWRALGDRRAIGTWRPGGHRLEAARPRRTENMLRKRRSESAVLARSLR